MLMRQNGLLSTQNNFEFYGSDINIKALECAKRVSQLNNNQINFIEDNLAYNFLNQIQENGSTKYLESFDLIVFNPPYVVTDENEL